jgi:hypothetical protein
MPVSPSVVYLGGLAGRSMHKKAKMSGKGTSVLLQNGGSGAASTYSSVDDYIKQTDRNPFVGGALGKKLEALSLANSKKPKVKNIKFSL